MDHTDKSLLQVIARYYSPFALPHRAVPRGASRDERARIRRLNMLDVRPFLRHYIFRSGQLVVGCFVASLLFASLLPVPILAIAASLGVIVTVLHTVMLIFMQQRANDIAAREERHQDKNSS